MSEGKWVKTDEGVRFAPKICKPKGSMPLTERIESALNMIEDIKKNLIEKNLKQNPTLLAIDEYLDRIYLVLEQGILE